MVFGFTPESRSPSSGFPTLMQESCFAQLLTQSWLINIAETFVTRDREFKCRTFQMIDENLKIVGLNVGVLG